MNALIGMGKDSYFKPSMITSIIDLLWVDMGVNWTNYKSHHSREKPHSEEKEKRHV